MARPQRIEYEGACYHVTSRGNERRKIYFGEADYEKLKSYLKEAQQKYSYVLHCYVLMSNHYHLLIETPNANMSKVMHYINGSYTNYVNRRRRRSGHLFQGRYKAIVVDRDRYVLELSRYLHLNPVRAKMVSKPEDYRHSSYRSYVFRKGEEIVSRNLILEMISTEGKEARKRYRDFVEKAIGEDLESPLKNVYGGVILGGQQFIKEALGRLQETVFQQQDISKKRELQAAWKTDDVIEAITSHFEVSADELFENRKAYRNVAIYLMRKHTGLTNRQIADLFGNVSYSAVAKAYQRFADKLPTDRGLRKTMKKIRGKMSNVKT
jgi:REP element-mobilizing transposase RayT